MVVLVNRGARTWDLRPGKDKEGKDVKRQLKPGESIEALDEQEAAHLLGYHREIVDAEKAMPVVADKMKALHEQVATLTEKLAEANARLAKYESTEEDDDKKKGGKKK